MLLLVLVLEKLDWSGVSSNLRTGGENGPILSSDSGLEAGAEPENVSGQRGLPTGG